MSFVVWKPKRTMAREEYEKIDFDRISPIDEVQTIPLNPPYKGGLES